MSWPYSRGRERQDTASARLGKGSDTDIGDVYRCTKFNIVWERYLAPIQLSVKW